MEEIELTAEQQAEAEFIEDVLVGAMRVEARQMARLMASKENRELFGRTEFQLRKRLHGLGCRAIDATLESRKKRGTEDPQCSAPTAANR